LLLHVRHVLDQYAVKRGAWQSSRHDDSNDSRNEGGEHSKQRPRPTTRQIFHGAVRRKSSHHAVSIFAFPPGRQSHYNREMSQRSPAIVEALMPSSPMTAPPRVTRRRWLKRA